MSSGIGSGLWAKMKAKIGHLVGGHGAKGEVGHVRNELASAFGALKAITVEEYDAPPAAAVTALMTATATKTSAQVYSGSSFNGALATALTSKIFPPRNITVTTGGGTATHAPASVTVNGYDAQGKLLSETITGVAGGAATYSGIKAFATVLNITTPAAGGTDATIEFGIGAIIGLSQTPILRTGQTVGLVSREIVDGALVSPVTGALTAPATNPPYGAYTPAAAPNGTHQYAIDYEFNAGLDIDTP